MRIGFRSARRFLTSLLVIGMAALPAGSGACLAAETFHKGGTGECDGCHGATILFSSALFSNNTTAQRGSSLKGSDPSSTCLICHTAPKGQKEPSGHYVATRGDDMPAGVPPAQLTPGGDFGWLKKTYQWSPNGGKSPESVSPGERHGHSIVAPQYGYARDASNGLASGGTYPSDKLTCISCHDPHGNYRRTAEGAFKPSGPPIAASGSYSNSPNPDADHSVGSYRLLAGKGYKPKNLPSDQAFTIDPPAAVAPVRYNRAEAVSDTRVAYGSGMSEWCQNCHIDAHKSGGHPSGAEGRFSDSALKIYNSYLGSGNLNGSRDKSYSSLVPYEMGTKDYAELKKTANSDGSDRSGPGGGSNVMCLSCHRAHASGWDHMGRWNLKAGLFIYNGNYPGIDKNSPANLAQGRTSAESQMAYFGRPADSFSSHQRELCSKCHAKD